MTEWSPFALLWAIPVAGLLGAVPTGYALGALSHGVDVRAGGSGNIGATNVNRLLGWRLGLLTLGLDALKGAVPAGLGLALWPSLPAGAALGLAALLGHCWSPLLDWRGGKGVATAAGLGLVLAPQPTVAAAAVWALGVGLSRRSSVGALLGAATLPLAAFATAAPHRWAMVVVTGVVLLRHRENWARLRAGAEHGLRAPPP